MERNCCLEVIEEKLGKRNLLPLLLRISNANIISERFPPQSPSEGERRPP